MKTVQFAPFQCYGLAAIVFAIAAFGISTAQGETGHFMLDLEANGATPGGAGGKNISISSAGETVTLNIYALFQGSSNNASDYYVRQAEAWFRSSNGGLLGNLSAANGGNFNAFSQVGTLNDIDADGDLDIGGSFNSTSQFFGVTDFTVNYGAGLTLGSHDGTISAVTAHSLNATIPSSGLGMAYALIGYLTWTQTGTLAGSTTATAISNFGLNNASISTDSAQDIGVGTGGNPSQGRFIWGGAAGQAGNNSQVLAGAGVVISVVPEPATLVLVGFGALGLLAVGIRRGRIHSSIPS